MKNRWIALLLVSSALAGPLWAATYYVDDDIAILKANSRVVKPVEDGSVEHPFGTIEQAIEIAADGDTIVVAPGYYLSPDPWKYAELGFKGKSVRLVGSAPTDFGVVEQTVLCGVIVFDGIEDANSLLQGFKIQNHTCGGILGNGTQATVSHCILSGNGPCGATVIKDVKGPIRNCLIVDNTTFHNCGTDPVVSGCPTLINCTIANNASGVEIRNPGTAIGIQVVRNSIIYGNEGDQVLLAGNTSSSYAWGVIDHCLLENWSAEGTTSFRGGYQKFIYGDPCFVRAGRWVDVGTSTRTSTRGSVPPPVEGTKLLIEGDYHLRTEGWRWNREPVHGSNWYYDATTSLAVDAGDPMDSLGEELERAPDDPEGRWGFNHAIDMGVYGGTTQASLSPTRGETPGVGAVDLADYWPLRAGNQWFMANGDGTYRVLFCATFISSTESIFSLGSTGASDWPRYINYSFSDRSFYLFQPVTSAVATRPPQPSDKIQTQYPRFPVAGSTVDVPYDPFTSGTVQHQKALIVRGTLAEVLAGTSLDPVVLLKGPWPDVIAFMQVREDGTAGEPIAIFARGLGPLFVAGYPVVGATINGETLGTAGATPRRG